MTDESLKACFSQGIVEMVLLIREKPDDIQLQINLVATSLMKIVEELKRRGIE